MTTPGAADSALLNQILTTLTSLGERLAVVEADLKTVIRDHTKDLDDHEARIRSLETVAREAVTRSELDADAADRAVVADRKANIRIAVLVAVVAVVNIGVAWYR